MTGSFTGSLDGAFSGAGGAQVPKGGKKRGRKSKAEKEREREREREEGTGRGGDGRGSVDVDVASVRGTGNTGGNTGGNEDAEEDEDFDDEGELLGREEGATDIEAEKKNLACVFTFSLGRWVELTDAVYWLTHLTPNNQSDTICSSERS